MPRTYRIGQEEDVEGQGLRLKDAEGNEWVIASDRVTAIAWTDASGEQHDVEGHGWRFNGLSDEPGVEGHAARVKWLDQNGDEHEVEGHAGKVRFLDDDGNEQEVEGHAMRMSDVRLKRHVAPLGDSLARVTTIASERR